MEYEVQKYLRSEKTLEDLVKDYFLHVSVNEELGVVALNYNQIESPMDHPIPNECRALILELETWNVVSRSFSKFYNHQEGRAAKIDWNTAYATSKLDGSLISVWKYKGLWRVSTKGTTDASGPLGDGTDTFRDLIDRTIKDMGFHDLQHFCVSLGFPDYYCLSFELTSHENPVVIIHDKRQLTLIGVWAKYNLNSHGSCAEIPEEMDIYEDIDDYSNLPKVEKFNLNNLEDIIRVAEDRNGMMHEGFVASDKYKNRIKVKNTQYCLAHQAISHMTTDKQRLELVISDSMDDVLALLPPIWQQEVERVHKIWIEIAKQVRDEYDLYKDIDTQKNFALAIQKNKCLWLGAMFEMRKNVTFSDYVKRTHINQIFNVYSKITGVKG